MKKSRTFVAIFSLAVGVFIAGGAYGEKINKDLARKMAVATYYEPVLKQKYGMAVVSVQGPKGEELQISMVRITNERIQSILDSGVYKEAKKVKFKKINFIDANQEQTSVQIK